MSALQLTGDEVLARSVVHNPEALGELYRRYAAQVYGFIRSRCLDHSVAEDLTSQVFLNCLRSARTFRGDAPFRAWLFRIARNCVATWRHRASRGPIPLGDLPDAEDEGAPPPDAHAVGADVGERVRDAIAELPAAQREVAYRRFVEGQSIAEVAEATGRTPGATRVLLHRARARLGESLGRAGVV